MFILIIYEANMAIYMFKGTYTDASIKAIVKKPVDVAV